MKDRFEITEMLEMTLIPSAVSPRFTRPGQSSPAPATMLFVFYSYIILAQGCMGMWTAMDRVRAAGSVILWIGK